MEKEKLEALKALARLCEYSARIDPNPNIGKLLPKRSTNKE